MFSITWLRTFVGPVDRILDPEAQLQVDRAVAEIHQQADRRRFRQHPWHVMYRLHRQANGLVRVQLVGNADLHVQAGSGHWIYDQLVTRCVIRSSLGMRYSFPSRVSTEA